MILTLDMIVLGLVLVSAGVSLFIRDLMAAAIAFGAYSFLMCLVWTGMGAVDVAFTEAAVGAGVSTVLFVATIYNITRLDPGKIKRPKLFSLSAAAIVIITGGLLLTAISDFPIFGDAYSPVNREVGSYYIEHAKKDTKVPNFVTAVLADYRGFDTMFETGVVFIAGLAIYSILKRKRGDSKSAVPYVKTESLIIQKAAKIMVPFMQLFALYVVAHGHYSPGGGFQGGVILGASLILMAMATNIETVLKQFSERAVIVSAAVGVLIFAGWGFIPVLLGSNFLDYSALHVILPGTDEVMARSHSMLIVEIGVAITVMMGMFGIYASLASDGRMKEGL